MMKNKTTLLNWERSRQQMLMVLSIYNINSYSICLKCDIVVLKFLIKVKKSLPAAR